MVTVINTYPEDLHQISSCDWFCWKYQFDHQWFHIVLEANLKVNYILTVLQLFQVRWIDLSLIGYIKNLMSLKKIIDPLSSYLWNQNSHSSQLIQYTLAFFHGGFFCPRVLHLELFPVFHFIISFFPICFLAVDKLRKDIYVEYFILFFFSRQYSTMVVFYFLFMILFFL